MVFLDDDEVHEAYLAATKEALVWREDYSEYERLMNNGLLEDLDENLPEVNDGSLSASLFKLAKRVIKKKLGGRAIALDADDAWITELANITWEKKILPNATSMATPRRKWKDAVRKAAGYGSQPIITLFVERGSYTGSDFIIPPVQDVKLEAGKSSDTDSDIIFWDVYYTKLQVKNMLEQARAEAKESKATEDGEANPDDESYNTWNIPLLEEISKLNEKEDRPQNEDSSQKDGKAVTKGGVHFYIAFQRGVDAPFTMCYKKRGAVRKWSNPDPTGDVPVHYLYCYQDFVNPYGIGIVKLAGGTQNVLDYMRQADIKATQLGIEPPIDIAGDADSADLESFVYAQRAMWFTGNAVVKKQEMANGVYEQLPNRIAMYQTSLQKLIPIGDTTVAAGAGDPQYSKTPAGVKQQQANLSIDDEDFSENVDETYEAVAKSMINTHFANMQGRDLMKLSDEERDLLMKAGLEFPQDEQGNPTNQLEVIWDEARATFDFEMDAEQDKTSDDKDKLNGLLEIAKLRSSDPNFDMYLQQDKKKLDMGELYGEIIALTSDNKKIIKDITPEEQQQLEQQQADATKGDKKSPSESVTFKDAVAAGAIDAAAAMLVQAGLPGDGLLQAAQQPDATPTTDPAEMAVKQAELGIKQQQVDQKSAEITLKAHEQGHKQAMDKAQMLHTFEQADVQAKQAADTHQLAAKTASKKPVGATK